MPPPLLGCDASASTMVDAMPPVLRPAEAEVPDADLHDGGAVV